MLPVIPLLILGGGGILAYALTHKNASANVPTSADTGLLASKYAVRGPNGEQVFLSPIAQTLVNSLASQTFTYPDASDSTYIQMAPDPKGNAISIELSAYGWAKRMNVTQSILAPLYLAEATNAQRFLRAVDSGNETKYAGPGGMYAVLLYAGTLARGLVPPGQPGQMPAPAPMEPQAATLTALPPDLVAAYQSLLAASNPDPDQLEAVAAQLDLYGIPGSDLLRTKASDLRRMQAPPAPVQIAPPPAPPPPMPTFIPPAPSYIPPAPLPPLPDPIPAFIPGVVDTPPAPVAPTPVVSILTTAQLTKALGNKYNAPPGASSATPSKAQVQKFLNDNGYATRTDGVWDASSVNALALFQQQGGMKVDGIWGKSSYDAIKAFPGSNVSGARAGRYTYSY